MPWAAGVRFCLKSVDGGAEGDRTPDLRIANATLSELSYGPIYLDNPRVIARRLGPRRAPRSYGDRSRYCQAQPRRVARCGCPYWRANSGRFTSSRALAKVPPCG